VALLGPNGAGKTTTIDMLLGLSQPTDGQVSVYGMHPRRAIERGLVSAVLQTGGLLKDLTVAETAQYTASLFAGSRPVDEVLRTYPHVLRELARFTPLYGLGQLVHAPLLGGGVHMVWVANAVGWLVIFSAGAVWRFRKDTARV
jgi:ABC-type sulfate/molybdate transport systems ATPase subunit